MMLNHLTGIVPASPALEMHNHDEWVTATSSEGVVGLQALENIKKKKERIRRGQKLRPPLDARAGKAGQGKEPSPPAPANEWQLPAQHNARNATQRKTPTRRLPSQHYFISHERVRRRRTKSHMHANDATGMGGRWLWVWAMLSPIRWCRGQG